MKTNYLKDYKGNKIAYLPVGTFEWHGNHLPLETDVIVAESIAERLSKEIAGFVMPGIYLGTDKEAKGKIGMEKYIGKKLYGGIYYLEPKFAYKMFEAVVKNLIKDDFEKIVVITGHAGSKQKEALAKLAKNYKEVIYINPFEYIDWENNTNLGKHAGIIETSLFWACRPEEETISREIHIPDNDDYFVWYGQDPREKSSAVKGQKILDEMIIKIIEIMK
jgi:creatinine amidohydrolase